MKLAPSILLLAMTALVIDSCTKTETKSSAADASAALLAGPSGSTKSWQLTSISESMNGGTPSVVTATSGIAACESDNIFTFSNNATQSYQQTEGATSCASTDPSTIETGSWAFTADGKSLLIESSVFPTSTQFQNEGIVASSGYFLYYFILNIGFTLNVGKPMTVTQLTSTSLTVTYSWTDTTSGTNYVDTLIFTAKK